MGLSIEERYDEFLKACQTNDLEVVEDLIFDRTFRLDVNRSLKDGANAIIIAAQEDKYQLVKLLLLNGADANSKIPNGWSVLMLAIRTGNYDTCKLLIDKGANINEKSPEGMSPLTLAAFCDNFEIVKLLVQKGANVNAATEDGKTPLNQAKSKEIKEFLIENGAVDTSIDTTNYKYVPKTLKSAQENFDFAQELQMHNLYTESIIYFDKAIEMDKKFARAYTGKGLSLLMTGKYYEAIAYCARAAYMNPYDSEAFLYKGDALTKIDKNLEALNSYDKAL